MRVGDEGPLVAPVFLKFLRKMNAEIKKAWNHLSSLIYRNIAMYLKPLGST